MTLNRVNRSHGRGLPPGRTKIADALRSLLAHKEFTAITTAEIARTAGVTEALIYKYFKDKRGLLHTVLGEYLEHFLNQAEGDLNGVTGALNKLRTIIRFHIHMYASNRVFAKILLLEVRNYPEYFNSEPYGIVKRYGKVILDILNEGIQVGEIRADIPVSMMRQIILGSIEHACLPAIVFDQMIDPDEVADSICHAVFNGIARAS